MWILRAAVCLTVPVLIAGQCSKDIPKPAPLSPAGDDVAVAVWSEVAGFRETYVVREVYDKSTDRAFLEYYDKGAFQKLLFDRKKKLFYSYTDDNCTFLQGDKIANFYRNTPLFKALDMKKVPEKGFLGPASIFDDFSASKEEIEKLAECDPDRLVSCTEYRTCDSHPALYRYSADGTEIFGQSKGRPLRYRREWSFNSRIAVEVLSIKSYTKSQDLFIPTGLSCENPNDEVVAIPFDTGRRSFVGEVVMTTDLSDKVFVSKLDALIIPSSEKKTEDGKMSGIYSFTKTSFRTNADGDLVPDAEEQIIHDVEHRVVFRRYTRDDKDDIAIHETKCHILSAEDFNLELEFPAYGSIRLEPIFLGGPVDATWSPIDYSMKSHLGANKIGDTETDVYEMTYPAVETGNGVRLNRLVVSHHFSATSIFAVEINAFNQSNFKIFSATIYISQYENKITQLNEKLRVDDCPDYQDSSESRWLEIGFVYPNSEVVAQVEESAPQIKDAFIDKLQSEFGVDPMRLPQINVDFVEQQVLVNALLLERPLIGMAYKDPQEKEFKKPTRVLGIMSSSACQITCLGMGENECTAISYCGATCSISDAPNPAAPALTVNSDECWLSERNFDRDIAVSSRILRELRAKVTTPATVDQLRLKIITADGDASSDGSQEVELLAITYDDTKNFDSAFHFDKEKTAILDSSFKIAMAKRRYKTESRGSLIGSFQLEDCALACKNRPTCEALSYCMNSMECVISGDHEIDADEVQEDSACIVYQKRYLDRFERFPGLSVLASKDTVKAADEESCAQKCVQRPDCKSFEFCDSTGDCLLLTTHISDAKVESNDQNAEQAKCSHYSKRFLFDYAVVPKTRGNGDETTELAEYANITQAACAKLCSEWGDKDKACFSFDFCGPATDNTGVCTLRTVDGESQSESPTCNFLYLTIPPGQAIVQHGSGEAIGLSILMMVIGAGLAVGGLFLYTKYA